MGGEGRNGWEKGEGGTCSVILGAFNIIFTKAILEIFVGEGSNHGNRMI